MSLTEDEARKKWCPFTRNGNAPGCNRNGGDYPIMDCIASECMAWRPGNRRIKRQIDSPGHGWTQTNHGCAPCHEEWHINTGYCGLAGNP